MPNAEHLLWSQLKGKQLSEYKFRRQYSVDKYILDFYCAQAKLEIEVDGPSHFEESKINRDELRQNFIESYGIELIRFTNNEIYENMDGVLKKIQSYLLK